MKFCMRGLHVPSLGNYVASIARAKDGLNLCEASGTGGMRGARRSTIGRWWPRSVERWQDFTRRTSRWAEEA